LTKTDNDLKPTLQGLTTDDLIQVVKDAESILIERFPNDVVGMAYDELRTAFTLSPKFSGLQAFSLKPWDALPKAKKAEFKRSWLSANKFFSKHGFKPSLSLRDLIIKLVVTSPLLPRLSFPYIIESLEQIEYLFDCQFPRYAQTGAIGFLQQVINGKH
jgi:hypothetical protein